MLAAVRRLTIAFAVLLTATLGISLGVGLLLGSDWQRAASLGLDLVGAFFLVTGFFVGVRGPVRLGTDMDATGYPGGRLVRWASPDERVETINLSALFVTVGFVFALLGIALDPRYTLL